MLGWLVQALYPGHAAEFPSDYSLPESVRRLRSVVKPRASAAPASRTTVGRVGEDRVRLYRVRYFSFRRLTPIFVGRFKRRRGRLFLEGRFTVSRWSKITATIWVGFFLLWTILATLMVITKPDLIISEPIAVLFPLAGVTFLLFGSAVLRSHWRSAHTDIDFLSKLIELALSKPETIRRQKHKAELDAGRRQSRRVVFSGAEKTRG